MAYGDRVAGEIGGAVAEVILGESVREIVGRYRQKKKLTKDDVVVLGLFYLGSKVDKSTQDLKEEIREMRDWLRDETRALYERLSREYDIRSTKICKSIDGLRDVVRASV